MEDEQAFNVVRELQPVRIAIGLSTVRRWMQRGVIFGASLALAIVATAHVHPFALAVPSCIAAFALSVAAGGVIGISHWPTYLDAARAADHHFDLKDRLTSALELRSQRGRFAEPQLQDTRNAISQLALGRSGRSRVNLSESALATATVLVLTVLLVAGGVPKPVTVEAKPVVASQRIHQAATVQLPQIVRNLDQRGTTDRQSNPALKRLNARLAQLRASLLHASNTQAALRSISVAQQTLQRLQNGLHPISVRTLARLNRALAHAGLQQSVPRDPQDPKSAAQALAQISRELGRMNQPQLRQLAVKLSTVAKTTPEGSLRKNVGQAASWLARNNPKAAQKLLNRTVALLHKTAKIQAARKQLASAGKQLDALKNAVSGLRKPTRYGPSSGKANSASSSSGGTHSNQQNVKGSHLGLVPNKSRTNGRQLVARQFGAANRSKPKGGSTSRDSSSNGSAAVHVLGGHDVTRSSNDARYVTVHVAGHEGTGIRSVQRVASGAPKQGRIQWYRPVILRYAQSAHAALDRSDIPPDLKSYVRRYFTAVSH
jgi:hypothetical protein